MIYKIIARDDKDSIIYEIYCHDILRLIDAIGFLINSSEDNIFIKVLKAK